MVSKAGGGSNTLVEGSECVVVCVVLHFHASSTLYYPHSIPDPFQNIDPYPH